MTPLKNGTFLIGRALIFFTLILSTGTTLAVNFGFCEKTSPECIMRLAPCGPTRCFGAVYCADGAGSGDPGNSGLRFSGGCTFLYDPIVPLITPTDKPVNQCGSIVKVDNLTVGESVPIVGTNFVLNYFSDRAMGRKGDSTLNIPMRQFEQRSGFGNVNIKVTYGGQEITHDYSSSSPDILAIDLSGSQSGSAPAAAKITITHDDPNKEYFPFSLDMPIGLAANVRKSSSVGSSSWALSPHHTYDVLRSRIYYGHGEIRAIEWPIKIVKTEVGYYYVTPSSTQAPEGYMVTSVDGSEVYIFNLDGIHQETRSTRTGKIIYTFAYAENGNLESIEDSYGNKTRLLRPNATTIQIQAPYGQITTLTLNAEGQIRQIKDPGNKSHVMTYHPSGLMKTFKKPSGAISTFTFDDNGFLKRDSSNAGSSLDFIATLIDFNRWRTIEMTTAENRTTKYDIQSEAGIMKRWEYLPGGATRRSEYVSDWYSGTVSETGQGIENRPGIDPRYDRQVPYAAIQYIRSPSGQLLLESTTTKRATWPLDDFFKLLTEKHTYEVKGNQWIRTYDSTSERYVMSSPLNRTKNYKLDEHDQVIEIQEASFAPVNLSYDARGKLSQIKQGTRETNLTYDINGLVTSSKNPMGQETQFTYNANGEVTKKTLADGRVFKYQYDGNGNMTAVTPASQPMHSLAYNFWDMISSYLPPSLAGQSYATTYDYNRDRQMTKIQKPDGTSVLFNYDQASGLLSGIQSAEGLYPRTYFPTRQLQSVTTPNNVKNEFIYDGDFITKNSQSSGNLNASVEYTYDTLKTKSIKVTAGTTSSMIQYEYDNDSLLSKAGDLIITRDPLSNRIIGTTLGEITESLTYDPVFGELQSYTAKFQNTEIFKELYARDALGRISAKTVTAQGQVTNLGYAYDATGRLTWVYINGVLARTYKYDGNSNRVLLTEGTKKIKGTYDEQDRLLTYGTRNYVYTNAGDRNQKYTDSGSLNVLYTYDSMGGLQKAVRATKNATTQITTTDTFDYINDSFGRRVERKKNGASQERYVYDQNGILVSELNAQGKILSHFIYGTKSHSPDYMIRQNVKYKILHDHLGSPRFVVNSQTGEIKSSINYDEFGTIDSALSVNFQPFGFAGGIYDVATKLVRFGARDYDAETGRWTSKDPISFNGGDSNLYGYVLQDPVNLIDPSGLYWFRQWWQEAGQVGRVGSMVPPAPEGKTSDFIESYVPAGYTFGQNHDRFVDWGRGLGAPDWLVNIPSMIPLYLYSVGQEALRSGGIISQPEGQMCK